MAVTVIGKPVDGTPYLRAGDSARVSNRGRFVSAPNTMDKTASHRSLKKGKDSDTVRSKEPFLAPA
jgi:hypothetical protein